MSIIGKEDDDTHRGDAGASLKFVLLDNTVSGRALTGGSLVCLGRLWWMRGMLLNQSVNDSNRGSELIFQVSFFVWPLFFCVFSYFLWEEREGNQAFLSFFAHARQSGVVRRKGAGNASQSRIYGVQAGEITYIPAKKTQKLSKSRVIK